MNKLLSVSEVAEVLRQTPRWVKDHSSNNRKVKPRIPFVKMGRKVLYRPADIEDVADGK